MAHDIPSYTISDEAKIALLEDLGVFAEAGAWDVAKFVDSLRQRILNRPGISRSSLLNGHQMDRETTGNINDVLVGLESYAAQSLHRFLPRDIFHAIRDFADGKGAPAIEITNGPVESNIPSRTSDLQSFKSISHMMLLGLSLILGRIGAKVKLTVLSDESLNRGIRKTRGVALHHDTSDTLRFPPFLILYCLKGRKGDALKENASTIFIGLDDFLTDEARKIFLEPHFSKSRKDLSNPMPYLEEVDGRLRFTGALHPLNDEARQAIRNFDRRNFTYPDGNPFPHVTLVAGSMVLARNLECVHGVTEYNLDNNRPRILCRSILTIGTEERNGAAYPVLDGLDRNQLLEKTINAVSFINKIEHQPTTAAAFI